MKYANLSIPFKFLLFLLIFTLIAGLFSYFALKSNSSAQVLQNEKTVAKFTVVLDAGHGGEDGGAVSASGIYEKNLNLY